MRGLDSASFREIIFIHPYSVFWSQSGICREQILAAGREPECNDWAKGSAWAGFGTYKLKTAPSGSHTSGGSGVPNLLQSIMNVNIWYWFFSSCFQEREKNY